MPDIEGLEKFGGDLIHSAAWNHDLPLAGKRIGVVGNGSSGVQMMAPLSEVASRLTLFQRTAQWIMPMGNHRYTDAERQRKRRFPILGRLARMYYQQMFESFSNAVVVPGKRRQAVANRCRKYLASVEDPELRAKLTPDYEPMCKRLVMSRDFYPTLMKEHVDLVTESIDHVDASGIVTDDGVHHELDVLVLATGFDAHAWGVDHVVGEEGLSLKQAWANGTRAYRSIGMPGFPNFFMLVGPNSPIGNISLIDVSEVQADYIMQCLELLRTGKAVSIAPNAEATVAFHATLLEAMEDTVWVTGCNSWYLDEDGVPITWPWSAGRFHKDMRRPNLREFDLA
jgi:cation diffusion facilitator CzcD-associated flavoprotein CzcO